jgi:hypothetical protein
VLYFADFCGSHHRSRHRIIKIPKKKTPGPNVKEKRKAGTRAGLPKPAIAAAAKLSRASAQTWFSLRKLAKALGAGPILLLMFFWDPKRGLLALS